MIQSYLKIPQVRPLLVTLVCAFCLYSHLNIVCLNNKQKAPDIRLRLHFLVGMTGFEPAAPTSLTWCANRAAPHPEKMFCKLKCTTIKIKTAFENKLPNTGILYLNAPSSVFLLIYNFGIDAIIMLFWPQCIKYFFLHFYSIYSICRGLKLAS
jgi:hypothetical protein